MIPTSMTPYASSEKKAKIPAIIGETGVAGVYPSVPQRRTDAWPTPTFLCRMREPPRDLATSSVFGRFPLGWQSLAKRNSASKTEGELREVNQPIGSAERKFDAAGNQDLSL